MRVKILKTFHVNQISLNVCEPYVDNAECPTVGKCFILYHKNKKKTQFSQKEFKIDKSYKNKQRN